MRRALMVAAAVALASGCAYYNGLFNANHLAGEARRAEREGRTGEARSLWSRAAVKAESVAVRFPRSKYRDDALLLQGQALTRLGACGEAVHPLAVVVDSSPTPEFRTRGRLLLGRCWTLLRQPDSALRALAPLADSGAGPTRAEALLLRGQAWLAVGRLDEAERDLAASGLPEAVFPRAMALARLGRVSESSGLLGPVVDEPYVEEGWLPALDTLGARAPDAASGLVDRLTERRLPPGAQARLLISDGERWGSAGDTVRAAARYQAVAAAVPDSLEGLVARAHLAIHAVRSADRVRDVRRLLDSLRAATRTGGAALRVAGQYLTVIGRVADAGGEEGTPLQRFMAAEDVRDSLSAPRLAAALFRDLERRDSTTVLAPKALLALAGLEPGAADSLAAVVLARYPQSVYALALTGQAGERYHAVEDSLRALGRDVRRRPGPADRRRNDRNDR